MKRFFTFFFLFTALIFSSVHAQNFEFEVIRTPEVPGFFMVRIFAGENNTPLPIQNIFVKNYSENQAQRYADIIDFIEEFGGKIIDASSLEQNLQSKYNKIIFLGGKNQTEFLQFIASKGDQVLEEFSLFARENLGPIFLKDIRVNFGGNASEVFPQSLQVLGTEPIYFVGKFEKAMKTRMAVESLSSEGTLIASAPLHLEDSELARGDLAKELPFLWEELWEKAHTSENQKEDWEWSFFSFFPIFMLFLGLLVIYRIFVEVRERKKEQQEFESSLHQNKRDQVWKDQPMSFTSEESLPFSVEKKENQ